MFILIAQLMYMLFSDVSLRRQASMTELKIPGPFLLKSDVNLFRYLVEADVAGCCSAGSVLR